jgi:hypothetical protein
MTICVKIWLSLDICVKYAQCVKIWLLLHICVKYTQCVKIWPFDVLVLFLKRVQFLKPCFQFLMGTILNLTIVQFLMKKKGDKLLLHVSPILGKGRHDCRTCVSYLSKREMRDMGAHLPFAYLHKKWLPIENSTRDAHRGTHLFYLDTCSVYSGRHHM